MAIGFPPTNATRSVDISAFGLVHTAGIIGNVTSFIMFLLPLPIVIMMIKTREIVVNDLRAHLATLVNCSLLIIYGIFSKNNKLVVINNGVGLVLTLLYIIAILSYGHRQWRVRDECIIWVVSAIFAVIVVLAGTFVGDHGAKLLSGIVCFVFAAAVHLYSDVRQLRAINRAGAHHYVPFFPLLFGVVDGAIWLIYALGLGDNILAATTGMGLVSSLFQFMFYYQHYTPANPPAAPN